MVQMASQQENTVIKSIHKVYAVNGKSLWNRRDHSFVSVSGNRSGAEIDLGGFAILCALVFSGGIGLIVAFGS